MIWKSFFEELRDKNGLHKYIIIDINFGTTEDHQYLKSINSSFPIIIGFLFLFS